jgi:hypothetical protein
MIAVQVVKATDIREGDYFVDDTSQAFLVTKVFEGESAVVITMGQDQLTRPPASNILIGREA